MTNRSKTRYWNRRLAGLCTWCGEPALPYKVFCQKHKEHSEQWRAGKREELAAYARDYRKTTAHEIKAEVFAHYGNKCACPKCPEPDTAFLTIHHLTKDARRRDKNYTGFKLYLHLKSIDYPDDVCLFCYNCNCGSEFNTIIKGVCPHMI